MRLDAYAAQRRYRRNHAVVAIERRRFVGIASELGDDAERPKAPCDFGIGELIGYSASRSYWFVP